MTAIILRRMRADVTRWMPAFAVAWLLIAPGDLIGQGSVDPEHGVLAVARILRSLGSVKRVLVIGAHPDDEDTDLLAWVERGLGGEAAYLSLSRGEGGQNLIGPELGVGLGLIRTEELLSARRLDGAQQFFSRAYDFGYSKTAAETFRFWPKDSLLADVVAVIRRFRPQVVVSIFTGGPRDRHGQHQVAGIVSREAFAAAGDPARFPEQLDRGLQPWAPLKLYRSTRFDRGATTLTVETGVLDPLYGRSYHQIAMASRSQHRSQDMGRIETLGPMQTSLELLESRAATAPPDRETSLFDGIDTTLSGMLGGVAATRSRDSLAEALAGYVADLRRAREALGRWRPSAAVGPLSSALASLRRSLALAGPEAGALRFVLGEEEAKLETALAEAAGVIVEAFSDDDLVVPGEAVQIEVQIWNGGDRSVDLRGVALRTPEGWWIEPLDAAASRLAPGTLTRRRFRVTVPEDARPTQPYFLRAPRSGALYTWPAESPDRGLPFGRPPVEAQAVLAVEGSAFHRTVEAVYRFADQARGEVRRPIRVVPAVGLTVAPTTTVWPLSRTEPLTVSIGLRGESPEGITGRVRLEAPAGWTVTPAETAFRLSGPGSAATVDVRVKAPPGLEPGAYELAAVAESADGRRYRWGYSIIDYPHIRRNVLLRAAEARIEAFELQVDEDVRVGYVPGAGDEVADAIGAMGVSVDVLDDRAIATGDLSLYDVIVVGIRAYETNPTTVASNGRLLDWVRAGGTLITQYQQYSFFNGDYAPYPLKARSPHDRVSDERAPVKILKPDHPVFNYPNRLGSEDFEGWVQERGLYFAHEWDDRYEALLEMADPDEAPKRGSLLVARLGEGLYVYTGLALFRQLPAGVPGAYRLLANLLSLKG